MTVHQVYGPSLKSLSSVNNGACVTVSSIKSYRSISNGACVTIGAGDDGMALWDSKNPDAGAWILTWQEWDDFLDAAEGSMLMAGYLQDVELVRIPVGDGELISVEDDLDGNYTWRFSRSPVVHSFTRNEMDAFWFGSMMRQFREGWMPGDDGGITRFEGHGEVLAVL